MSVVLTGISGNLGRAVAKVLHREVQVLGVDRRPFVGKPKDVEHFQIDLRKKKLEDVFKKHKVNSIIHMGIMHDPRMSAEEHHSFNVVGTTRVLECAARFGVKKVVMLSSANVYGPSPDNSNFLSEESPLMAASRFPQVRDLIEVDMLAHHFFWKHPTIETVVLRPVHIVGPTIRNAPSNYLRLPRPWVMSGFDPMLQLIHVDDVANALKTSLTPGLRGVFNVVGPGEVPLSKIHEELKSKPRSVPHLLAKPLLGALFKYRLASYPPEELDHIQFLCMVDGTRWKTESSWAPSYSMKETIRAVLGE
jgi:UDP-glucose 4-epimerase